MLPVSVSHTLGKHCQACADVLLCKQTGVTIEDAIQIRDERPLGFQMPSRSSVVKEEGEGEDGGSQACNMVQSSEIIAKMLHPLC